MGGKKEGEKVGKSQGKPRASVIGGAGDPRGFLVGLIRNLGYFSVTRNNYSLCSRFVSRWVDRVIVRSFPVISTLHAHTSSDSLTLGEFTIYL